MFSLLHDVITTFDCNFESAVDSPQTRATYVNGVTAVGCPLALSVPAAVTPLAAAARVVLAVDGEFDFGDKTLIKFINDAVFVVIRSTRQCRRFGLLVVIRTTREGRRFGLLFVIRTTRECRRFGLRVVIRTTRKCRRFGLLVFIRTTREGRRFGLLVVIVLQEKVADLAYWLLYVVQESVADLACWLLYVLQDSVADLACWLLYVLQDSVADLACWLLYVAQDTVSWIWPDVSLIYLCSVSLCKSAPCWSTCFNNVRSCLHNCHTAVSLFTSVTRFLALSTSSTAFRANFFSDFSSGASHYDLLW
jgi:hypothetical protein